jgi:hypothetical protein
VDILVVSELRRCQRAERLSQDRDLHLIGLIKIQERETVLTSSRFAVVQTKGIADASTQPNQSAEISRKADCQGESQRFTLTSPE